VHETQESDLIDLFDLLDSEGKGSVGFKEIFTLILFLAAFESNAMLKCLYMHSGLLYSVLVANGDSMASISGQRFASMLRLVGANED